MLLDDFEVNFMPDYKHLHDASYNVLCYGVSHMMVGLFSRCVGANSTMIAMIKHPRFFENIRCMVAPQSVSLRPFYERITEKLGIPEKIGEIDSMKIISGQSLIKPHLLHLSGSGQLLRDAIVERNVEFANHEFDTCGVQVPRHVLVVPTGKIHANLEWTINDERHQALFSGDQIIINPAGLFVTPRWDVDVELVMLAIEPALLASLIPSTGEVRRIELLPQFHIEDPLLQSLVLQLIAEFEHDAHPDLAYAEALTHAAAFHLARHYAANKIQGTADTPGLSRRQLSIIKSYVHANLSDKLTTTTLAKAIGISQSHFNTSFKQATGKSPYQYVMEQRLERARALLMQARLSIIDIAAQTGFADQSHLTRAIRSYIGQTPRTLQRGADGACIPLSVRGCDGEQG